jgi:hypothetical protein
MTSCTSLRVTAAAVRLAVAILVQLTVVSASPAHEEDRFTRFFGGGSRRTDCMMLVDVEGVRGQPRSKSARCTDGDIGCDSDGIANGVCAFRVRLCMGETPLPAPCRDEIVTGCEFLSTDPSFTALSAALAALPMPAPNDTCTAEIEVPLSTAGGRAGRALFQSRTTGDSGHVDSDRLKFLCRPARVPPPATFATIQDNVFKPLCSTASCHGAAAAGGLDLTPEVAYANLVGVLAANLVAEQAGLLLVVPGDPGGSFLFSKLTGTLAPGQGLVMPRVGSLIPVKQIELIRRWIIAGAPADAPF